MDLSPFMNPSPVRVNTVSNHRCLLYKFAYIIVNLLLHKCWYFPLYNTLFSATFTVRFRTQNLQYLSRLGPAAYASHQQWESYCRYYHQTRLHLQVISIIFKYTLSVYYSNNRFSKMLLMCKMWQVKKYLKYRKSFLYNLENTGQGNVIKTTRLTFSWKVQKFFTLAYICRNIPTNSIYVSSEIQ